MNNHAHQLAQLRESLDLTLAELAQLCGTSRQAIYYWESEKRTPSGSAVALLDILSFLAVVMPDYVRSLAARSTNEE